MATTALMFMPISGMMFMALPRRRSEITRLFFDEETGIVTLGASSAGYIGEPKMYIQIPPDFTDFELKKKITLETSEILNRPSDHFADKFAKIVINDSNEVD
jgi:hypothetical protein